jgi:hypothetical protein
VLHHALARGRRCWRRPPCDRDRALGSKAPLSPTQAAAASLALERACGPIAPPDRVARIERPRSGRAQGPVLGRVDRQPSPLDLAVVKELDRCGSLGFGGELNEREPPGSPGLAIRGQVDLDDAASLGQERGQRICGGAEGEIPDEDAGCDGWFPPVSFRVWSFSVAAMVFQYL